MSRLAFEEIFLVEILRKHISSLVDFRSKGNGNTTHTSSEELADLRLKQIFSQTYFRNAQSHEYTLSENN